MKNNKNQTENKIVKRSIVELILIKSLDFWKPKLKKVERNKMTSSDIYGLSVEIWKEFKEDINKSLSLKREQKRGIKK